MSSDHLRRQEVRSCSSVTKETRDSVDVMLKVELPPLRGRQANPDVQALADGRVVLLRVLCLPRRPAATQEHPMAVSDFLLAPQNLGSFKCLDGTYALWASARSRDIRRRQWQFR